jgi:hypothetical protein
MKASSILFVFILILSAGAVRAADYRVGIDKVDITPNGPIWMSGYANRTKPSEGVLQRLYAKALAIEDKKGGRIVIVTTDLIGLPRVMSDVIGARVEKEHGLERARLVLNSSHTHTGPVVRPNLSSMYNLDAKQDEAVRAYAEKLTDMLVHVVGAALKQLKPANISYGVGEAKFAINRREATAKGVRIGLNARGSVDHSVPVLRITGEKGELQVVLFGYACHNTTLTGEHYQISGDYAGFAQEELEKSEPGATALFLMLCGADQNPNPRTKIENVQSHGSALATEVKRVLGTKLQRIKGETRAAFQIRDLPLTSHSREDFEKMLDDKNVYRVRLAKDMLKAYDERRPIRSVAYPVQAVALGRDLAVVALGGEVVVDYGLQIKKKHPKTRVIVAGYSNDVMCYIPTARILKEGGYEAVDSMVYYGMPTPFTPEVEELVLETVEGVLARVGIR